MTPNPRKSGLMLMERLKVEDDCPFQWVALVVVVAAVASGPQGLMTGLEGCCTI